jgi:hypothetical protein
VNASIIWTGTTFDGRIGTAFGSSGTISILLGTPTTSNFVQCIKPDLTAIACDVQLSITKTDGAVSIGNYYVPAVGGLVNTLVDTTASIAWQGTKVRLPQVPAEV